MRFPDLYIVATIATCLYIKMPNQVTTQQESLIIQAVRYTSLYQKVWINESDAKSGHNSTRKSHYTCIGIQAVRYTSLYQKVWINESCDFTQL